MTVEKAFQELVDAGADIVLVNEYEGTVASSDPPSYL